jgi:hypothetical protein
LKPSTNSRPHAVGLAQHVVRRARELERVRQQHRIHGLVAQRQILRVDHRRGAHPAEGAEHRVVQGFRAGQQLAAESPVAHLKHVTAEYLRQNAANFRRFQRQQPLAARRAQPALQRAAPQALTAVTERSQGHGLTAL